VILRACVKCGTPSPDPYCDEHRPKDYGKPFWGGQGSTSKQARQRKAFLGEHRTCVYCGAPATQVDHVVPISRGGADDISNFAASCAPCNLRKGNR